MPSFDLPGDPGEIRTKATGMRTRSTAFGSVATGLDKVSTDGWLSRAADLFREQFTLEPGRWRDSGNGFVKAAGALEMYAGHLEAAQSTATWARTEYARGDALTATARTAYDVDIARGRREKADFEAHGGVYTLTILPFSDPGEAVRAGAVQAWTTAKTELETHAHTAADEVRAACAGAPGHRNWLETGLAFVGDVFVGVFEAVVDLGKLAMLPMTMLNEVIGDLAKLATGELSADELAMKYRLKVEDAEALFTAIRDHPGDVAKAVGKGILDWDTWTDDPAKAIGHLIPDIVIAVATLGGGTAASATERGAVGAVRGAEGAEDLLGAASRLDDVAGAGRALDTLGVGGPLPDLSDIPFAKGTPEWADAVHDRYPDLSASGALGIYDYTTDEGFTTMNAAARSPGSVSPGDLAAAQERIAATDEGLSQLPTRAGTTYRGADLPGFLLQDYRVGNTVSDPAFTSTSASEVVAHGFRDNGNAFIEVRGETGRAIEQLSRFGTEGEVLYPRVTSFHVTEVRDAGGYRYYVLEEVPR